MNIIKVQQTFKRLPDEKVAEYVRDPALGFIALMELNERKKERDRYQAQSQQPDIPLSERIPQELGIMSAQPMQQPTQQPMPQPMQQPMPQPMQPQMGPAQPVMMAGGGIVAFQNGGDIEAENERLRRLAAARQTPQEYMDTDRFKNLATARQQMPARTTTASPSGAAPAGINVVAGLENLIQNSPLFKQPAPEEQAASQAAFIKAREAQLPDEISPMVKEYIKSLEGRKTGEEEARRQMFRDFGIAALKGGSRDFFQNIGGAAESAMSGQAAIKKANLQLEDMAQQQRMDMVKFQMARKEGNLKAAEEAQNRMQDRKDKMLAQASGIMGLQDQLSTSEVQRKKYLSDIAANQAQAGILPLKTELLRAQIEAAKRDPSAMAGVPAASYANVYGKVIETDRMPVEAALRKTFESQYGKKFMDDPTAAANFKALVEKELRERTFARFGITDPSQMRIIQDIPKRAAVLGEG